MTFCTWSSQDRSSFGILTLKYLYQVSPSAVMWYFLLLADRHMAKKMSLTRGSTIGFAEYGNYAFWSGTRDNVTITSGKWNQENKFSFGGIFLFCRRCDEKNLVRCRRSGIKNSKSRATIQSIRALLKRERDEVSGGRGWPDVMKLIRGGTRDLNSCFRLPHKCNAYWLDIFLREGGFIFPLVTS